MDNVLRHFKKAALKGGEALNKIADVFDSNDPLIILPYRGYANAKRLFLKGRVLEDENIFQGKSESEIRNLIDSFKRFETDEMPNAKVRLTVNNQTFEAITDEEGYFTFDEKWHTAPQKNAKNRWFPANLKLVEASHKEQPSIAAKGEIYYPSYNADYGIITDMDDTVLQTHVTSLFRLKMLYATFIQDGSQRLPMEGIVDLFQAYVRGGDGKKDNPVFYVSNSPWNLYDLLEEFLQTQKLPKGPILLRDYGIQPSGDFSGHKMNTITHILEMYPKLPFVMLGDTASKDADFYIELAKKYPNRIKAIYIRQTRNTKNARRVAKLIEQHSNINAVLVDSSKEMINHGRKLGLLHFGKK